MRPLVRRLLTGIPVAALLVSLGGLAASGVTSNLTFYLSGDSVPVGSMSTASPPDVALDNLDPGRDFSPGIVLARSTAGAAETDSSKYQQWEVDATGTLSVSKVLIWGALKNFDRTGSGLLGVYLLDCETSCTLLESQTKSVRGTNNWSRITVPLSTVHEFALGHSLAVKLVVLDGSDSDMWFAYGTSTYSANVAARDVTPTTTTTTTTTTPAPTTTVTGLPVVTTTLPSATATLPSATASTTSTSTTSTTLGSGGGGGTPPTTTAPVAGSGGSAATVGEASSTPGADVLLPEQPLVIVGSVASETLAVELPAAENLTPQQGLMVAFATMAQTFQAQLLAAVALGLFGLLLILAIHGRQDDDYGERTVRAPGSWWFGG